MGRKLNNSNIVNSNILRQYCNKLVVDKSSGSEYLDVKQVYVVINLSINACSVIDEKVSIEVYNVSSNVHASSPTNSIP